MNKHVFDRKKWQSMTIFEQMGNIGSEVGRALNAKKTENSAIMEGAFYRGLDLIDATVEGLVASKSPRTKELLRAREVFSKSILTDDIDSGIEQYFMDFAVVARTRHLA